MGITTYTKAKLDDLLDLKANVTDLSPSGGASLPILDHGSTSGTVTLDASAEKAHKVSATDALAIDFAGFTAGKATRVPLMLAPSGKSITWPANVKWMDGVPPSLSARNLLEFTSYDAGATVLGSLVVKFDIQLPAIGDTFMGGFYVGVMDTTRPGSIIAADAFQTGLRYALILAPKSLEQQSLQWRTSNGAAPAEARTRWNGLGATAAMATTEYPAANYCAGLSHPSDGASPWYLPAMDELELIYRVLKPTTEPNSIGTLTVDDFPPTVHNTGYNPSSDPSGAAYTTSVPGQTTVTAFQSGGAEALYVKADDYDYYWSSTEYDSQFYAWSQCSSGSPSGYQDFNNKISDHFVRPVRRIAL